MEPKKLGFGLMRLPTTDPKNAASVDIELLKKMVDLFMREDMARKGWTVNFSNYGNMAKSFGKAADCVACGQCEGVCPQHLPVIDLMKKVSEHFDH